MRQALYLTLFITACSAATQEEVTEPLDVRSDAEQDQQQVVVDGSDSDVNEHRSPPPDQPVPPPLQPAAGILTADVPRRVEEGWNGIESIIPFQRWPQVPRRVVGVLFAAGNQPWGGSVSWMRGIEMERQYSSYRFCFEGSSPYAIYFVSDGQGENFMEQWTAPTPQGGFRADVAMFSPSTSNQWGLNRRAHLVELEVNNGQGGEDIHFIVTDARVIDESQSFPIALEAVLIALRQRFDRSVAEYNEELERILAHERSEHEGQNTTILEPRTDRIGLWPTWHNQDQTLSVTFIREVIRTAETPQERPQSDCPPCAQRAFVPPLRQSFGVEMAGTFVIDREGALVSEGVFPPRARE